MNMLADECNVFCGYLINQKPNNYVLTKYCQAHRLGGRYKGDNARTFDRMLTQIAGVNPFLTGLADSYARFFCKSATLRKKLVLLLAILESCGPTCRCFDMPDPLPGA